jgi:hypothetical protein
MEWSDRLRVFFGMVVVGGFGFGFGCGSIILVDYLASIVEVLLERSGDDGEI